MLVAYDGSGFRGFAENSGVRTVGGELRRALETVLGEPVDLAVAGRTDAGVHARGQVVSFDSVELDTERLARSLRAMLAPEIVVRSVEAAGDGFHARFSARWRRYRYRILAAEVPDPAIACTCWWIPEPLDLAAIRTATGHFVGTHDFSAFCRRPKTVDGTPASLVRRVLRADWESRDHDWGEILELDIAATAFCHQMVRSIVGTVVEVGRGRLPVEQVLRALESGQRSDAGRPAPPGGLTLWEVGYDGTRDGTAGSTSGLP